MPVVSVSKKFLSLFLVWIMAILPLMQAAAEQRARAGMEQSGMLWTADPARLAAAATPPSSSAINRPSSRMHAAAAAATMQSNTLAVSVGYADNLRANPNFPVPWQGSPNIVFRGAGPTFDAGAIRLDNLSSSPLTIDSVVVDLGRPGPTFNLWGTFTIPAQNSAILTQTGEFNFDTSDFPIVGCGQALSPNETRIPKITITIAGTPTTFLDTGHILDTGGFDLVCQGNESLGWRPIGTTGIQNTSAHVTLGPATSVQATGASYTATAVVTDAGNQPIANVVVDFKVLSGPNAGKTGQATTDATGSAPFTYTSLVVGTDILQATVTNAAGGSIQSDQVTTTWTSSNPCSPSSSQSSNASATTLTFAGQGTGEFNDPLTLAAQLTDGDGNALAGRSLNFTLAQQPFQATTDGNGVATVNIGAAPSPGVLALNVSFAGETNFQPAQLNTVVTIGREETALRYTGPTLLGTGVPQQVTAVLVDGLSGQPIANETVLFQEGSAQAQGTTNAQGVATATLTLASSPASGQTALQVSFAGDNLYKASRTSVPVTVYLPTSFVVWGGNSGGLQLGQDVNFWGHSWTNQVTGGNFTAFTANPSFKGFADPGSQVNVCEVSAGSGGPLDDSCWSSKPGNSFPPATLPPFIRVIVSTAITMSGSTGEIFGNIASTAVCQVDPKPVYGNDPGKPGFCKLVAVLQDGGNIFPTPPALTATQTQPAKVLQQQSFNVTAAIANNSGSVADSVALNESFDGVTPATGNSSFSSILSGAQQTATFQVTSPAIPLRQSSESSVDYQTRLANTDGRVFTSTGTITFTDSVGQQLLPITVSSSSQLQLPELTLGISGPSCVGPGSSIPYKVTVGNQGTAEARNVSILMNFPDGSNTTATIASIPVNGSVTTQINFVVPAVSAKQPNETDQQYRARLAAIDGSSLVASAKVNWQDTLGSNYGVIEQKIVTTTERVPIIVVTPQAPLAASPGQQVTLNLSVQNLGGGNASQVLLKVISPDGSTSSIAPFALQGGQANVVSSGFTMPVVPARQAGETDAAYQARLVAQDGKPFNFQVNLSWNDVAGDSYGPTSAAATTSLVVPIVTISLTAPPISQSGATITYSVSGANAGHADASNAIATITFPDGSKQQLLSTAIPVQGTFQQFVPFTVPRSAPASTLTATATVNWKDASQDSYGPLSSTAATANTVPQNPPPPPTGNGATLQLLPLTAGPNNTGRQQTVTATLKDNNSNPLSGVAVQFTVFGANPTSGSATTDANGNASFTYTGANPGNDQVVAMATSNGNTAISNSSQIAWIAPVAVVGGWIGSPANGAVVQRPITISLPTVTLQSGTVSFWPVSNPSAVTVLNPNASGSAGTTLATFDPTILANGSYIIQVQGTDSSGNQQTNIVQVTVIGENKPGRITKTVTDLQVPLSGLPIAITRTYDSLNRSTVGDFGFGWALSVNVNLQVDSSFDVTFKLNGKRETFFFQAQPSSFLFPWLLLPTYVPQPGVFGTLTSDGCSALIRIQGQLGCFVTGNYQPTTYTYTDPTGRFYVFGANGTMKSITDPTGNTLSFTASGITSSAGGVTVPFLRDTSGRITTITDPNGNVYGYSYDTNGNLASVSKPGVATPVTYTYTPDHFLLTQTGPQGNTSSATYYPDGRLQSSTDALGNVTQYSYNLATNTTTTTNPDGGVVVQVNNNFGKPISITDPLNRTTTFTYDGNQNLLTRTDALGHTTTYTYDANGNTTSTRDALGNTVTNTYSNIGELIQTTDALQHVSQWQHDGKGHATALSDALGPVMSASYDAQGNRISQTLPNGATSNVTYNAFGNPTSISDHGNFTINNKFDANGHLIAESDAHHGSQIAFQFDALGNTTQVRDPLGRVINRTFDGNGNLTSTVDQNGNKVTYTYDGNSNLTSTTYADGTTVQNTYDFAGRMLTRKDELGNTTTYTYDKAGELTSVTEGSGTSAAAAVSFAYDAGGRISSITDERNNVTQLTRDADGRITATKDALGRVTSMTYDGNGHLISQTVPGGATTTYTYDARGRMTQVLQPDNTKITNTYSSAGLASVTDEAGSTRKYTRDSRMQLSSVTNANGYAVQYVRDQVGNLTGVIDANGNTTTYQYDTADRMTRKTFPDGSFEAYTYDGNDNLIAKRLTDGNVNKFTYDQRDRLTGIQYFDGKTVSFSYTLTSKRQSVTTSLGTTKYAYDTLDRLISITEPGGQVIAYTYDGADNITSISDPAGTIHYAYDAINRLTQVTDRLGGITTYSYNAAGRVSQRALPNGVVTKYSYDVRNRLIGVTHSVGTNAPFESFQYTLGPSGKRLSVLEASGTKTTWTYDPAYRLTEEDVSNGSGNPVSTTSFAYDAAGNRTAVTLNGTTTRYQYNALDQLTSAGAVQYGYDGRGNLIQVNDPAVGITSYTYDAANRMASAGMPTGVTAFYSYDGDGRLVQRTIGGVNRNYFWNEISQLGDILFETNMNGQVAASYTLGQDDLIQQTGNGNAQPTYFLKDGLGSVIGLTDPNGNETNSYRYEAYGNLTRVTGTSTNPYGYRSQRVDDASGLVYLRARYYNPLTGRFTARDKADFVLDNPVDLNRYGYVADDPINNYDPTGKADAAEEAILISAEEENTIINAYTVGRADKAWLTWVADYFLAFLAVQAIANALPYGEWLMKTKITVAFGFVLDVNIGTLEENYALRASNTPAARKILLGYASEFEADPGGFRFALSGSRNPWQFLLGIVGAFGGLDNSLDFGNDQCANHAERKIANGATGTILSIAPYPAPVCITCWMALHNIVDVLGPLGFNWCKQDPTPNNVPIF